MKSIKEIVNFNERFCDVAKRVKIFNEERFELVVELQSGKDFPETVEVDFSLLIDEITALRSAKDILREITRELKRDLEGLWESKNYDEFITRFQDLIDIKTLRDLPNVVKDIINMELSLALSFITVIKKYPEVKPEDYAKSLREYFFAKNGYQTVSGDLIIPPKFPKLSDLIQGNNQSSVRGIGNQINAERYIRDITRIIVETTGDEICNLRDRYSTLAKKYKEEPKKKLVGWFDSFGDFAEASVMPVVEEVLSGVGNIELNPLIVAGVGTFCSVTVRKATEHAYLELLGI